MRRVAAASGTAAPSPAPVLAATLAVTLALGATVAAPARAAEPVPATASADWLVGLLGPDAVVVDPALEVVDVDATLDLLLGLIASGAGADTVATVAARLAERADEHTGGTLDATFVSVTAKLVLALDAAGLDPRDVAGEDLVALLAGRVGDDGRATDRSELGDLSTPRSQALTVLALDRLDAGAALVLRAADALAGAACADGGVPAEFDAATCTADPVTTALGAAALAAAADAAGTDAALTAARDDALRWLLELEVAGRLGPWPTGLTATALRTAGRDAEAVALTSGLAAAVDGCDGGATAAVVDASDPLRATVGTLLAAGGTSLGELSVSGAASGTSPLECGTPVTGGDAAEGGDAAADVAPDAEAAPVGDAERTPGDAPPVVPLAVGVLVLIVLAGVPVLRRARRRDEADRAAARRG